jgi:ketosteroid isomerase-like protein
VLRPEVETTEDEMQSIDNVMREEISVFLARFERNTNSSDAGEVAAQFADTFMAADASGARAVPSSAMLRAIPERRKMFERLGSSVTSLKSVEETRLDDRYVLLRVEWLMKFEPGGREVTLRSTFVLHRSKDGWKVVFYLNHEDLAALVGAG